MNVTAAWDRFLFRPAPPLAIVVCRAVAALNALWIVLSRPSLPEVLWWPEAFWTAVSFPLRARFLLFGLTPVVEWSLFVLLIASLTAAVFGVLPRASCLLSAVLLYRFAPLEMIFSVGSGPHFRGLTVPDMLLFLLAFTQIPKGRDRSPEYGWPLVIARLLVANIYVSAGIAKLWNVGPAWFTPGYFASLVRSAALPEYVAPWAGAWANRPFLGLAGAIGAAVLDFAILIPLFRPRTSWLVVPVILIGHFFIARVFGVIILSAPMLVVFFPWEGFDPVKYAASTQPRGQNSGGERLS